MISPRACTVSAQGHRRSSGVRYAGLFPPICDGRGHAYYQKRLRAEITPYADYTAADEARRFTCMPMPRKTCVKPRAKVKHYAFSPQDVSDGALALDDTPRRCRAKRRALILRESSYTATPGHTARDAMMRGVARHDGRGASGQGQPSTGLAGHGKLDEHFHLMIDYDAFFAFSSLIFNELPAYFED